jgi:hypothetical protein
MLKISKTKDLDIKEPGDLYSRCVITTNANYISKSKIKRDFILKKYSLYNNMQIACYANITPKLKTKKHAIIISIYAIR